MSLMFRAMYRLGFKPWDSGISPPELKELVDGPRARTPGKALDLGCGTGTNAVYLAQHGWDVTAVDFVPRAISMARAKSMSANVAPRLLVGDVTRLDDVGVGGGFTLVFDQGCLHGIAEDRRGAYAEGVTRATVGGADFLVWGFTTRPNRLIDVKLTTEDLDTLFGARWDIVRAWEGVRPGPLSARWYHLKRK